MLAITFRLRKVAARHNAVISQRTISYRENTVHIDNAIVSKVVAVLLTVKLETGKLRFRCNDFALGNSYSNIAGRKTSRAVVTREELKTLLSH